RPEIEIRTAQQARVRLRDGRCSTSAMILPTTLRRLAPDGLPNIHRVTSPHVMRFQVMSRLIITVLGLCCASLSPRLASQVAPPSPSGVETVAAAAPHASAGLSASDWEQICAAHQASLHDIVAADGAYAARNPGQSWQTRFD